MTTVFERAGKRVDSALTESGRRFRRHGAGQWVWRHSVRDQFRWGSGTGPVSSAFYRSVQFGVVDKQSRVESVERLIELFFGLIDDLDVGRFVEAGAKEADASQRAAAGRADRDVVAFEANPFTHRRFEERLRETRVDYRHLALSESPGTIKFNVRRNADGNPIADGQGSLLGRASYKPGYVEGVEVEAVTLDSFFAERDGGTISPARVACWVDVEGASSMVLRGAQALLGRTDVLMIEVEGRPAWDGQEWLWADVVEFVRGFGLVPIARDAQSRFQFNIVFVRDSLVKSPQVRRRLHAWRSR